MRLFAGTPFDRPPHCERCEKPETECQCPPPLAVDTSTPPARQTARLSTEKRKRGKLVTVIRGLADEGTQLASLLSRLQAACGAGGSVQAGEIELQGDHVTRVRSLLEQLGYRVRP